MSIVALALEAGAEAASSNAPAAVAMPAAVPSAEAPAIAPVPAIELAENAYRDALDDLAWKAGVEALFGSASDATVRQRAFTVLMKTCERRRPAADWLADLTAGVIDGRALPVDDAVLAALRSYWTGRALVAAGRPDEAVAALTALRAALPPGDPLGEPVLRLEAFAMGLAGRTEEAERLLATLAEPGADVLFDRSRLLLEAGRPADAAALLADLAGDTNQVEEAAMAALLRARALDDAGAVTNALAVLASALAAPGMPPDHVALALAASAMMRARESADDAAVDLAERAVAAAASPPIRLACRIELARTLAIRGRTERALGEARALVAAAPRSAAVAVAVKAVADIHLAAGRFAEALDVYALFVASFTGSPLEASVRRGQGLALSGVGRHGEAASAFQAAVALSEDAEAKRANLFNLAEAKRAGGLAREAQTVVQDLLGLEPPEPMQAAARLLAAECLAELDPGVASAAFIRVATEFPMRAEAGRALYRAAQIAAASETEMATAEGRERALDLYRRASEFSDPRLRAPALLGMGLMALRLDRPAEALAAFEAAADVVDGGVARDQARFMKAEALLALGREAEAVAAASAMIGSGADAAWSSEALFWMGRRQFNAGDFAAAEASFSDYVVKWPQAAKADSAMLLAAQAQFHRGRYDAAIETAAALVATHPGSRCVPAAEFTHAEALCELLQFDAALLLFDAVVKSARDDDLRLRAMGRRGDCFFTLGEDNAVRYAESVAAYEAVIAHPAPKSFETILQCQYKIGRSLEKAGRVDEALRRYYQDVILMFEREGGEAGHAANSPSRIWYSRAALDAAEILERRQDWKAAGEMLGRIAGGGFPGAEEAARRLARLRDGRLPAQAGAETESER